jgi:hypothetical protein
VQLEGLGKLKKKSSDLFGIRTHNLLFFTIAPEPTMLLHASFQNVVSHISVLPLSLRNGESGGAQYCCCVPELQCQSGFSVTGVSGSEL